MSIQHSSFFFLFFFFFYQSFNLWDPFLIIAFFYHQTKTLIGFWCRRRFNHRSFIQSLETLSVELTGIHVELLFGRQENHKLQFQNIDDSNYLTKLLLMIVSIYIFEYRPFILKILPLYPLTLNLGVYFYLIHVG